MWPCLIREPIPIGSCGVMAALGFPTAQWLPARDMDRRGIDRRHADTIILLSVVGGLLGAKLASVLTEAPAFSRSDFFSGSGPTWHGGLILAAAFDIGFFVWKRLPLRSLTDAVAPMLASGYAFGRLGCFLPGDGCHGLPCRPGDPFALCLTGSGVLGFLVGFIWRPDERPERLFGVRDAHLIAAGQVLPGLVLLLAALRVRRSGEHSPAGANAVGRP